ncbi:MAG: hypothetical protein M4579_007241 [Chaenotheca gracillima]|nr:MAG: hypothetical protein M4579_007241 [Chaenotheca gracillima]
MRRSEIPEILNDEIRKLNVPIADSELLLVEKSYHYVLEEDIVSHETSVQVDYTFENSIPGSRQYMDMAKSFIVRRIVNIKQKMVRPINQTAPLRAELELDAYGRYHFEKLSRESCIAVPFLCFIDGFGLYRNMYRSLMGVYLVLASMNNRDRMRRANIFPLTLGPHGSDFEDVIMAIPALRDLDGGMDVKINGEVKTMFAYTLAFIGDMPQQNENAGFKRQSAKFGCRSCLIDSKSRGDLDFDIVRKGRYHYHTLQLQRHCKVLHATKRKKFCQDWGLKETPPPLMEITPALDIIRSRPADLAHSEFAGMAKQAQVLLMEAILTVDGQKAYAQEFRRFPFPPGWGRLQSPLHHLQSWRMQEAGRASIITPMLLRCWLRKSHVQTQYLQAISLVFRDQMKDSGISALDMIVRCYGLMAKSNAVLMAQKFTSADRGRLMEIVKDSRANYQRLCKAAMHASRPGRSRSVTRSPTPTMSRSQSRMSFSGLDTQPGTPTAVHDYNEPENEFDDTGNELSLGPKSKRAKEYENFAGRPNVHQGLHFVDIAAEYATTNNVNVLMGEDQHRLYKEWVTHTNFRDVEKVLLHRENIQQTLRLCLNGSFANSDERATKTIQRLYRLCPTLLDSVLPISERYMDVDQSCLDLQSDVDHIRPVATSCLARRFVADTLGLPLSAKKMELTDPFLKKLRLAYAKDYDLPHVVDLSRFPFQWCRQVCFTDRTTEQRITFSSGDFISLRSENAQDRDIRIARLDHGFVHELHPGERRLFAKVTQVDLNDGKMDAVLNIPRMQLAGSDEIIGLRRINGKRLYVVPLVAEERTSGLGGISSGGGTSELLYSPYEINFL